MGQVSEEAVLEAARAVEDPELPMLTIGDLGMVRAVRLDADRAEVDVAPTYSGCPATEVIHARVKEAVEALGISASVRLVRSPAWSTDWITERGRALLAENGIAPPIKDDLVEIGALRLFDPDLAPPCPRCGSDRTEQVSLHGSTPCKSMHRCLACAEPFEHFKCH